MPKVQQTRDVQALSEFGFAASVASVLAVMESGIASASSPTTLTASGAPTSHAVNDCAGQIIVANTSATWAIGIVVYGLILANTTGTNCTFTVDKWYSLTTIGATATQPAATANYVILPVMAPFWYLALTDSTAAVAGTETGAALGGTELTTNGLGRGPVTAITRTTGSTIATMARTFTFSGSGAQAIGRVGLVNSSVAQRNFVYFLDQVNLGSPAQVSAPGDTFTPAFNISVG